MLENPEPVVLHEAGTEVMLDPASRQHGPAVFHTSPGLFSIVLCMLMGRSGERQHRRVRGL